MDFLIRSSHENLIDVEVPFAHTDSEEAFKLNLKKYGSDWYYAKNPITYKFNRLGYRMKQLEDVDYDNYYAFFGCSFTAGFGLRLEDTYVYKIAKQAGVDYVNASMGGSSVDFVYYNFINLMNKAPNKPKAVIINWPSVYRMFYWTDEIHTQFMLPNLIDDGHWKRSYQDFIVMDHQVFNRFDIIRTTIQVICKLANVPLFEMSTYQDVVNDTFGEKYPDIISDLPMSQGIFENSLCLHFNRARDISSIKNVDTSHPGFLHQESIVTKFFEVIPND
jgi:hypothetical protein